MKTISATLFFCFTGISLLSTAQNSKEPIKQDTIKQMNLLDEQAKILGSVFGTLETGNENPFAGTTNYLELIEKMKGTEEEKQFLRDQYKLYDLGIDPKKKEEFKIMFNKKLKEGMDNGLIEN